MAKYVPALEENILPKKQVILTREEELQVLKERNERIRKNPEIGFKMLQRAGIYDENGQLTEKYRAE